VGQHRAGGDFSGEMVAIAQRMFPQIEFCEGDAQNLPFADTTFDRVLANFALLQWNVPSARYPFDEERDAGMRTAGLLARQTSEKLHAIQLAIEESVRRYAKGDGFSIPNGAYVIAVSKT
jgi:trans-aconitate methyltransferase